MSKHKSCLLTLLLSGQRQVTSFTLLEWDVIIRQARVTRLLASLKPYADLAAKHTSQMPLQPLNHIQSTARQVERTIIATNFEILQISRIAEKLDYPIIVLKGAAYVLRQYPLSCGRIFFDVDILVAKTNVYDLENKLLEAGWQGEKQNAYDQLYYRKWMHELPPMINSKSGSSLDLHHNILPQTARIKSNVDAMIAAAIPIDTHVNLHTFMPQDIILHSLTHLFHEGEFDHGLRDLYDVHQLVQLYSKDDAQFWTALLARAEALNLVLPLYYGVKYLEYFLQTPVPATIVINLQSWKKSNSFEISTKMMDYLFIRALLPNHKSCDDEFSGLARWCLYVRSHYMRMPFYLLLPHLIRKAYMKRLEKNQLQTDEK